MDYKDTIMNRAQKSLLKVYDMETGEVELLHQFPYVVEAPNWMKDGEHLVYNANGKIYIYNMKTDESTEVYTGQANTCNNDHVLSPDGKKIGVSSGTDGDLVSRIYTVDIETKEVQSIVSEPWSFLHGWSPDGKELAYCAGRMTGENVAWDVYTVPAEGGEEVRLTIAEGLNDGPEYAPDGKKIWFNSVRTGLMQIWNMNTDGSGQTQMTFDENRNSWFPHVSPDGKRVVYLSYHKGDLEPGEHLADLEVEIRTIPAEGGDEKVLLKFFGGQGSINVNSWSPDSKKFAFVTYEK